MEQYFGLYVMEQPEFWFEREESGPAVMYAPGVALVFRRERGLGFTHAIHFNSDAGNRAIALESAIVWSARFTDPDIDGAQGAWIDDPVYQELVLHEPSGARETGLCALLTGSCFDHHFSAVFSLFRDPETPRSIVLDVDVADRCRGQVEKLAATYFVSQSVSCRDTIHATASSAAWQSVSSRSGRLELIAAPPSTLDLSTSSSPGARVQILAEIDKKTHTQRLRYRWRWASSSDLTR
jgi:hypothetical protein